MSSEDLLINKAHQMNLQDPVNTLPNFQGLQQPDSQFFSQDELVQKIAVYDPQLNSLIALYSPLMSTSHFNAKTVKILSLKIKGLMARKEALAYDDYQTLEDSNRFEANEMFLIRAINDSYKGWRLKALIERIKTSRIQLEKSGGILDGLRRDRG